ncbi:MAG: hypothetical protein OXC17_01820 [Aestuariivita sp.]|nr:hypothetical protein [Aestuariivita sp.]
MSNPFELVTASKLTAKQAIELWCDDNRLERVRGGESCFIHGNRGTGKSMLFRILQRDCQDLLFPDQRPNFLSVYFAVRDSDLMVEEFNLMQDQHLSNTLAESHLTLLLVRQLLIDVLNYPKVIPNDDQRDFQILIAEKINSAYDFSEDLAPNLECDDFVEAISFSIKILEKECNYIVNFVLRRLSSTEAPYRGPLFFFDGLLKPISDFLADRGNSRIFVLVDDADDLPYPHTVVLNSWIARRRRSIVFKVSTMYNYKTYETRSGSKIQQPHDFIQYNIASRFLEYKSEDYVDLIRRICVKRLKQAGYKIEDHSKEKVDDFFPMDKIQERKLSELRESLTKTYEGKFSGRSVSDNVYRHLTSEYMKQLLKSRSTGSYLYSGFRTLAILSSGLVRDFIICAQRMYDDAARQTNSDLVEVIPPEIQNRVVRDHADTILAEIRDAKQKRLGTDSDWEQIDNMIRRLGATFKQKMLSDDSERRMFSFAFQTLPESDISRLLDFAVGEGYLAKGFISEKEGFGRRHLYVMTRRIAPAFNLDVSTYSGYLSLTPSAIREMMKNGRTLKKICPDKRQMELPLILLGENGDWILESSDGPEEW